jgi:hypothetical protein
VARIEPKSAFIPPLTCYRKPTARDDKGRAVTHFKREDWDGRIGDATVRGDLLFCSTLL